MKINRKTVSSFGMWALVLFLLAAPGGIMAQGSDSGDPMPFRQEELDQMLAPIALYPDDLLSEILIAATYPLEVVEAARWIQANPDLTGDQLAVALEQKDWDPSVKSLVNFPTVLQMMSDNLEWTEMIGDAFLAGEDRVMDTIQGLRQKAQSQGTLRSTNELVVDSDPQTREIIIQPYDPEVIYVPVYDPIVVYGPWWWPAYPPFRYYPRGRITPGHLIGFGSGVRIGVPWGYAWGGCDWHNHRVMINITRHTSLNHRIDRNRYTSHFDIDRGGRGVWAHDPDHRRGVAYRTPATARQFGRGPLPGSDARRNFRGYDRPAVGGVIPQAVSRPSNQQTQRFTRPTPVIPEPTRPLTPIPQPRVTPSQQPRETPSQRIGRPEPQPRETPSPRATRPEPSRQLPAPVQQPQPAPRPVLTRPEGFRPPPAQIPREVQGLQGPTVFGGSRPGGETREDSHRGHESLSGARPERQGPELGRPEPGGGRPGGENPRGRGK